MTEKSRIFVKGAGEEWVTIVGETKGGELARADWARYEEWTAIGRSKSGERVLLACA